MTNLEKYEQIVALLKLNEENEQRKINEFYQRIMNNMLNEGILLLNNDSDPKTISKILDQDMKIYVSGNVKYTSDDGLNLIITNKVIDESFYFEIKIDNEVYG